MTIQTKATEHEQYFPVVLLFMLYKVVLLSLDGISRYNHSSESFCEHFFVVLFTVLLNVVPAFEFVRSYGDSNKSYCAVLSCGVMGTFLCYP